MLIWLSDPDSVTPGLIILMEFIDTYIYFQSDELRDDFEQENGFWR